MSGGLGRHRCMLALILVALHTEVESDMAHGAGGGDVQRGAAIDGRRREHALVGRRRRGGGAGAAGQLHDVVDALQAKRVGVAWKASPGSEAFLTR